MGEAKVGRERWGGKMGRERLGVKVGRGRTISEPEAIPEMGRVPRNGTGAQFEKPEI